MKTFFGRRGLSAVVGLILIAASNPATAAPVGAAGTAAATSGTAYLANGTAVQATNAAAPAGNASGTAAQVATAGSAAAAAVATMTGTTASALAMEAAWLYRGGWPVYALADRYGVSAQLDEQAHCVAVAVYHEARGETAEGQLAVARVIMNRAASGRYPPSWCEVVKQPWQFSFVNPRTGDFPYVDQGSDAWRRAVGITRLAISGAVPSLTNDVLWYHADYVAPSWGRRLNRVSKIGAHIFYRS